MDGVNRVEGSVTDYSDVQKTNQSLLKSVKHLINITMSIRRFKWNWVIIRLPLIKNFMKKTINSSQM